MQITNNDWDEIIKDEVKKPYYLELREFLKKEFLGGYATVYPPKNEVFSALKHTPYKDVKVVILGQDPYINSGEAHGMAFSVNKGVRVPPSLKNIFKELNEDLGAKIPTHGNLVQWASQGVLLLNTIFTVEAKKSKSHAGRGWEKFTDFLIGELNNKDEPIVFLLWGNNAKDKMDIITNPKHKVLTAAHPSPLAGGKFFGCKHFSKANEFLLENGQEPINWEISND